VRRSSTESRAIDYVTGPERRAGVPAMTSDRFNRRRVCETTDRCTMDGVHELRVPAEPNARFDHRLGNMF